MTWVEISRVANARWTICAFQSRELDSAAISVARMNSAETLEELLA